MAFPREYLNFTLWYLRAKGYVRAEDNSDYGLTAEGVDYLEAHSASNPLIRELLTSAAGSMGTDPIPTSPRGLPLPELDVDLEGAPYRDCN